MGEIDVTILMPCLNEERTIAGCIQWAWETLDLLEKKHGLTGEVLISDNGSSDDSVKIAEKKGARVIHCMDRGYGNALIFGVRHARGQYIVMGDADMSYDFRESAAMVEKLHLEGYQLCMGTRLKGNIKPGAMPWKSRIGNPLLSGTLNLLFRSGLSDAHCGLRAFTRKAFDRMKLYSSGMEFASEMLVKASILNLKRTEVPISLNPDGRDRPPHLRPFRDGWRHLKFMLIYSPRWLLFYPGIVLMLLAFIGGVILTTTPVTIDGVVFDVQTMLLAGLCFMGGHMLFTTALVARYFASIEGMLTQNRLNLYLVEFLRFNKAMGIFCVSSLFSAILIGVPTIQWMVSGFPSLDNTITLRWIIPGLVVFIFGLQIFVSGVMLELIDQSKRK